MELFKFNPGAIPSYVESGQIIQGAISKMWTERYRDPGEFEIKAPLSSGLREFLPLGTLISHTDSVEVMIVENHEIKEKGKEDPQLVITGRSVETFLENRIVGMNRVRATVYVEEYILPVWNPKFQATKLINDHISPTYTYSPDDALSNFYGVVDTSIPTLPDAEAMTISHGTNVHKALLDFITNYDWGIKTVRRNAFGNMPGADTESWIWVYQGADKTKNVTFSWKGGDLESAEYLFTQKRSKNTAIIIGRYCWAVVDTPGFTKYNRRMMLVDGDDIDGYLDTKPSGALFPEITKKMRTRGAAALKANNSHAITRTDITNITRFRYRQDYDVGDLVSLDGNFGQMATMRVVEYVEIEDENGESGHPTLDIPGA
jgi:Siphovirus ReqiPepy6 Gp37-like protein